MQKKHRHRIPAALTETSKIDGCPLIKKGDVAPQVIAVMSKNGSLHFECTCKYF